MQLRADALAAHLQSHALKPLYVIASNEALLALEAADAIRKAARAAGYSEREVHTVSPKFDWSRFVAANSSLSLFAEKRLVELRIPTGKPGKEGSQVLQQLAERAPQADESTLTLVALPAPDREMKAAKWFAPLQQAAVFISIDTIEPTALPRWISERLAHQQQRAQAQALTFIAERVEGNLLAAHQEIQKLALLYPAGELSLEQVQAAVLNVARYDVFKLSEALLASDTPRFARMLNGLRAEGTPLPLVLWTVAEDLRGLARVKQAQSQGQPTASLLRDMRVWGVRERLLPSLAQRLSQAQITEAIRRCAALDKIAKGLNFVAHREGLTGDPWADLSALGVYLCQESTLSSG